MEKLIATARKIDVVFKIGEIMLKIALVTCLVMLGIVAVGAIFGLPAEMIGTVDSALSVGNFTFHVAEEYVPPFDQVLGFLVPVIIMAAGACPLAISCVKTIRAILSPMKEGQPFHSDISAHFRKLGWLSLGLGVLVQVMKAVGLFTMTIAQNITTLLISEKVTKVEVGANFDLTVLIVPVVFFLLSYIFRYGAQLQQLSDETL